MGKGEGEKRKRFFFFFTKKQFDREEEGKKNWGAGNVTRWFQKTVLKKKKLEEPKKRIK